MPPPELPPASPPSAAQSGAKSARSLTDRISVQAGRSVESRAATLSPRNIDELRSAAQRQQREPIAHIESPDGNWSQENLSELDLSEADLRRANLRSAQALGTDLSKADLSEARLDRLAIDLRTNLAGTRLPATPRDTYIHVYARTAEDTDVLALYGIVAAAGDYVYLEFCEFLKLQPYYGYVTA